MNAAMCSRLQSSLKEINCNPVFQWLAKMIPTIGKSSWNLLLSTKHYVFLRLRFFVKHYVYREFSYPFQWRHTPHIRSNKRIVLSIYKRYTWWYKKMNARKKKIRALKLTCYKKLLSKNVILRLSLLSLWLINLMLTPEHA